MAREGAKRKELFTILGTFQDVVNSDGYTETRFVPKSTKHFRTVSRNAPKQKTIAATFYQEVATRSQNQLAYHFVLLGYLAEHTGYTKIELHDAIMRLHFGTKKVTLNGRTTEVRASISDAAKLSKPEVSELIEYDLEVCKSLEIKVPTPEELGYITESSIRYKK